MHIFFEFTSNVVIELLVTLKHVGCEPIAYTDDAILKILGRFAGTVKDRMQLAMQKVSKWTYILRLPNPRNKKVVLFTKRYRPQLIRPLKLHAMELVLKEEANILRLILVRKLNSKSNIHNKLKKASIALYN